MFEREQRNRNFEPSTLPRLALAGTGTFGTSTAGLLSALAIRVAFAISSIGTFTRAVALGAAAAMTTFGALTVLVAMAGCS